jgi:hypothetical protein|tara:strand:- start:291 stop:449 length:159 start_codon:yes stop_codon:yes gene_type:complete
MVKILSKIKKWFNTPSSCKTWEEEYLSQSVDRKDFEAREKRLEQWKNRSYYI